MSDWRSAALCREVGMELFFPVQGDNWSARQAKSTCQKCPVVDECREYAVEAREPWGIWGGLSERDRRLLRAKRNREAAASQAEKGAA